jgi:hypothetical protein
MKKKADVEEVKVNEACEFSSHLFIVFRHLQRNKLRYIRKKWLEKLSSLKTLLVKVFNRYFAVF